MSKLILLFCMLILQLSFSQENCQSTKSKIGNIPLVDSDSLRCLAKQSNNKNTIIYTFGVWCSPCRLHLKNAIALREKYNVNLLVLLIEPEKDVLIQKNIDYLYNIDSTIEIVLLKDKYGEKRSKKYKGFLKEITPKKFENLNGMSKYLVFDKKGELIMVTTWKDNRKYDWEDDSNMLKEKVIPLLKLN